jgi:hypothetical protein
MATPDITQDVLENYYQRSFDKGSDDGYVSDAFNNADKRNQRQLGTQQRSYRAVAGPITFYKGLATPDHNVATPYTVEILRSNIW